MEKKYLVSLDVELDDDYHGSFEKCDLSNVIWRGFDSVDGFVLNSLNYLDYNKHLNTKKLTDADFIVNSNEEEIFSVIESFLNRLNSEDFAVVSKGEARINKPSDKLVITDTAKMRIIREMIEAYKEYNN